jgi:hypothetical protein
MAGASPSPDSTEKCITRAKARKLSRLAELTDLQGDSKQEQRSLNHAASVALPASWYAANFLVLETGSLE